MSPELILQRCLELAERAKGYTAPNPMVGAVLRHEGRIIGEGWHQQYGQEHAELKCLESVTTEDRPLIPESVMYVSLEPCAHYGKTPPCAQRLVQERIPEVVIGNTDPFEQVSGRGIAILEAAGIRVRTGLLAESGQWLNRRFFCFHRKRRPYIILKWAESVEGFMASADNARVQLSNAISQALVHRWRTEEAAIMVGYHTALHDNPQLNARLWSGPQPLRIVTDRKLLLPSSHHLLDDRSPTWVIHEVPAKHPRSGQHRLPFDEQLLPALTQKLYDAQKISLIVEGGPALLSLFIRQGLWDEARIFKTAVSLPGGRPTLPLDGGQLAWEAPVGNDRLQLWISRSSEYPYAAGMSL